VVTSPLGHRSPCTSRGSPTGTAANGLGRLDADEKRHLEPLPVAVDVIETQCTQPYELALHVEQAVRRILILERLPDRREERQMQAMGWRQGWFRRARR
jgi:hypothetical protein